MTRFSTLLLIVSLVSCTSGPPPPDERPYETKIQQDRTQKDQLFRVSSDSPLPAIERATFRGLSYYPIDASYRVPARLEIDTVDRATILELPTSAAEKRRMRRSGVLKFTLQNTPFQLTAFVEVDSPDVNRLFLPFTDLTSNRETYGGGRYLELDRTSTGLYDLDFNRAYHPFCVYNINYVCPVPPRENKLTIEIRAGEKNR
jgi:uncharacterized protein (DUF1684 family)